MKRSGSTRKYVPILLTASCMDTTRTRQPRKPRFSTVFLFNENPADRPESGFDPSELVARLVLIKAPVSFTSLSIVTIRAIMRGATVRERLTNPHETRPDRPGPPLPKKPDNGYLAAPYLGPALEISSGYIKSTDQSISLASAHAPWALALEFLSAEEATRPILVAIGSWGFKRPTATAKSSSLEAKIYQQQGRRSRAAAHEGMGRSISGLAVNSAVDEMHTAVGDLAEGKHGAAALNSTRLLPPTRTCTPCLCRRYARTPSAWGL